MYLGHESVALAAGMSLANTFGIFGFRKDFFPTAAHDLPGWLNFIARLQTVAGAALLFLFAVAIRNRSALSRSGSKNALKMNNLR
jgi:hypothetical protein